MIQYKINTRGIYVSRVCKGYDKDGNPYNAAQRYGGWCEPERRRKLPIAFEPGA